MFTVMVKCIKSRVRVHGLNTRIAHSAGTATTVLSRSLGLGVEGRGHFRVKI